MHHFPIATVLAVSLAAGIAVCVLAGRLAAYENLTGSSNMQQITTQ